MSDGSIELPGEPVAIQGEEPASQAPAPVELPGSAKDYSEYPTEDLVSFLTNKRAEALARQQGIDETGPITVPWSINNRSDISAGIRRDLEAGELTKEAIIQELQESS